MNIITACVRAVLSPTLNDSDQLRELHNAITGTPDSGWIRLDVYPGYQPGLSLEWFRTNAGGRNIQVLAQGMGAPADEVCRCLQEGVMSRWVK